MKPVRIALLTIAILQIISTLIGAVQLLFVPKLYQEALAGTVFAGQYVVAGLLLGVVVGGPQWAAVFAQLRRPRWLALAHAIAGTVMVGWIAGECLVMNSFIWAHALWGGLGIIQLLLVLVLLNVLQPLSRPAMQLA